MDQAATDDTVMKMRRKRFRFDADSEGVAAAEVSLNDVTSCQRELFSVIRMSLNDTHSKVRTMQSAGRWHWNGQVVTATPHFHYWRGSLVRVESGVNDGVREI